MNREIENYNQAIAANPNDAELYYDRGLCYFDQERWTQAEADFKKTLELDARHVEACHNLALIADIQGDAEKAKTLLQQAIKIDEDHGASWFALGAIEALNGQYEGALKALARVIALEEEQEGQEDGDEELYASEAFALRAKIYLTLDENRKALDECDAYTSFMPEGRECEPQRALALLRLNRLDECETVARALLKNGELDLKALGQSSIYKPLAQFIEDKGLKA